MKDCKSEQNTLKILKGTNFWQSCRPPFCNFVEKSTPLQLFLVCLSFKNTCFKQKRCNECHVTQGLLLLIFSCRGLYVFNWTMVHLYKTRMNRLNRKHLFHVQSIKKKRKHRKFSVEIHSGKYMEITIWAGWCQNKMVYVIALPVVINTFLRF